MCSLKLTFPVLEPIKDIIITRNLVVSLILIFLKTKHIVEIHEDLSVSGKLLSKILWN